MWTKLGELFKKERQACGLSVREIERRSGVAFHSMYELEKAQRPGGMLLRKYVALCQAIGCDPAALLAEAMKEAAQ